MLVPLSFVSVLHTHSVVIASSVSWNMQEERSVMRAG